MPPLRVPQPRHLFQRGVVSLLAVHPGALGDLVLFGHLLTQLGGAQTLVAGLEKAQLLVSLGRARRAMAFDALPMHEAFADSPAGDCLLPSLLGDHRRLVSCFGGENPLAQLRLASLTAAESAAFLPVRPPADFSGHLLELWCDLLGLEAELSPEPWSLPADMRSLPRELVNSHRLPSDRLAVIHPGSGGRNKCWPLERFEALALRLRREGFHIVWSLGPVELDVWPHGTVERLQRDHTVLANQPLITLAGLLSQADILIGNDSGVAHLAAALGRPTVAIFGPSNPIHFRPLGKSVRVVQASRLDDITPTTVADAALRLLN